MDTEFSPKYSRLNYFIYRNFLFENEVNMTQNSLGENENKTSLKIVTFTI